MGTLSTAFLVVALVFAVDQLRRKRERSARLPPGPPGVPLFGNTFQVAPVHPWKQFYELSKQYGPVMRLQLGGQTTIILSSYEAAQGILTAHAADTASRPRQYVASDLASGGMRLLFIPHGPRWRLMRRALHSGVSIRAAESYAPMQEAESAILLHDILTAPTPERYDAGTAIRRFTTSIVTTAAYARRSATGQEENVQRLYECMATIARLGRPGSNIVQYVSWFEYLPGWLAPWRAEAEDAHKKELGLFKAMFQRARAEEGPMCFARELAEKQEEMELNDSEASYLVGSLFGAGSDTTAGSFLSLIQLLIANPEVQRLAQAEIDAVTGGDRLPLVSDIPRMPYVRGCVKEVLRIRPVTSGGSPHLATADIAYGDYIIPAGSVVQGNHWAINRDLDKFSDPEEFRPDRWDAKEPMEEGIGSFGYGRRVCPGQHVAVRTLFIATARLLFGFDLKLAKDESGNDIPIDPNAYSNGFNSVPLPFPAAFIPRDADRATVIKAEYGRAISEVSKYGIL
ncbi:cytochrome P450 [Exidia glandulosa HHB12029]|uniref:Cytochrome P450 n=1 Tax=Exidia glandulosa HHB12029 TaxID=1314781 RepID=A0A166B3B1_EXIGL|nr:cytochrome P450 [Exidia glandulosa HHB12029]